MHRQIQENLGLTTDLLLHAEVGSVEQDAPYIIMRTPQAPEYCAGNMLVLERRPSHDERQRLEDDFARLVGAPPRVNHRSFTWPEDAADALEFDAYAAHGYRPSMCGVLVGERSALRATAVNDAVEVRLFDCDRDWNDWTRMSLAETSGTNDLSRRCVEYQRTAYRRLIEKQFGNWWGAFIEGELVGSLGLFFFGSIGRFQSIVTRADQRNKRICRTLLTEVVKRTAGMRDRLVIVADEAHHGIRIYESLGFERQARIGSLFLPPVLKTPS